jgi:hypothetical protein
MFLLNLTLLATAFLRCATAQLPALEDPGQDLASYVSVSETNPVPVDQRRLSHWMNCLTIPQRPDLRPPLLNVTRYDADAITPGYLFMAPYASLHPASLEKEYVPFQAGPHIYDNKGVGGVF